jgi:hypothetical protein
MSILDRQFHREGTSEKSAPGSAQVNDAIERIATLSPQLRLAGALSGAPRGCGQDFARLCRGIDERHAAGTRGESIRLNDGPVYSGLFRNAGRRAGCLESID